MNGIYEEKTFTVDKLNSSNKVCVEDRTINAISDVSAVCSGSGEYLVSCPGNNINFTCSIVSDKFVVSGLKHSAVKEFYDGTSSCIPLWSCTAWSACINNQHTKTCTDRNNCGTTVGKPPEIEACVPTCTSDWNCTSWVPEKCPKEENQTRTCTDRNNCASPPTKTEKQNCTREKESTIIIIVIVLIAIVLIAGIIGLYFFLKRKENSEESDSSRFSYKTIPPVPPTPPAPIEFQNTVEFYSPPTPSVLQITRPVRPQIYRRPMPFQQR